MRDVMATIEVADEGMNARPKVLMHVAVAFRVLVVLDMSTATLALIAPQFHHAGLDGGNFDHPLTANQFARTARQVSAARLTGFPWQVPDRIGLRQDLVMAATLTPWRIWGGFRHDHRPFQVLAGRDGGVLTGLFRLGELRF